MIIKSKPGVSSCHLSSSAPSAGMSGGGHIRRSREYPGSASFKSNPRHLGHPTGTPNQASPGHVKTDRFWYGKGSTGV